MAKVSRFDGYFNSIIGHGLPRVDPFLETRWRGRMLVNDQQLANVYLNALAQRIVDLPADEALKRGVEIEGDDADENLKQMLDDLSFEEKFADALRWSRLFGGAAIFMLINDGGETDAPVNERQIKEVESLIVYDKREIDTNSVLYNSNLQDKNFGQPEFYRIMPAAGRMFYVHKSRLLIFDGAPLTRQERQVRGGWGMSALQGVLEAVKNSDAAFDLARKIMERVSQPVLSMKDLFTKVTVEKGDEDVRAYLQLIDMARSVLNTVAIDLEDKYEVHNVPLTGLPDLLDKFGQYVAVLSNIPFSILFGRSPTGLAATGQAELEQFYGMVARLQRRKLKPNLDTLVRFLQLSQNGPFRGKPLENWQIIFPPLWLPTDKEKAETEKLRSDAGKAEAETVKTLTEIGALDAKEYREKLKADGKYPIDESLDDELDRESGEDDKTGKEEDAEKKPAEGEE